jgi:dTDP-4-dehydrorhamnose 3,5-epimerase
MEEERGTPIRDVVVARLRAHADERGRFIETYRRNWFPAGREMVQANRVDRRAGTIVGLHYHLHQADYWYVTSGRARAVLHDLRVGSPTEGVTASVELGEAGEERGLYIPPGVAHGFAALTDITLTYLVDGYYNPADELGLAWDDPSVGANWGIDAPIVSARDRANPRRSEIADHLLPRDGLRT